MIHQNGAMQVQSQGNEITQAEINQRISSPKTRTTQLTKAVEIGIDFEGLLGLRPLAAYKSITNIR